MAFVVTPRPFDHPDVPPLVAAIQQLYVEMYGGADDDTPSPAQFTPPNGLFLLGYLDDVPVACGGWRRIDATAAEIKRMWVSDAVRGRGFARQLLAELEASAAAAGVTRMVLNTGSRQLPAIALYESSGYARTDERYGHYADFDGANFFGKSLRTRAPDDQNRPPPMTEAGG